MKMRKNTAITVLGLVATLVGVVATQVNKWVDDRTIEEKIDERINYALTEKTGEES